MDNKEKSKKLVCTICGQEVLKNPNISGKPYAVRKSAPVICDRCSHDLADIDDENQEKLEAKNYNHLLKKDIKTCAHDTKAGVETAKSEKEINLPDIIESVRSVIKGQDEAVKVISTAIFKNQRIDSEEIKSNLIIMGESGCGKTEILKLLASECGIPYFIEDATRYTEAGYVGASIDDMLMNLYRAAGNSIRKAERGLLIIDEGDKKASSNGDSGRDVSGENVLFSMLSMIGGSKVPITNSYGDPIGDFDTSRLTIIFIGAFPNLVKIREKRLKQKGIIGFNNQDATKVNMDPNYIADDFIEGGFPKEFVGRFDMIVELNKLTKEDLLDITTNSKKSTFVSYINALEKKGIKLSYDDEVIPEIAEEAVKLNVGARGIKKVVQGMFKDIIFDILCSKDKYSECVITKKLIRDSSSYVLS